MTESKRTEGKLVVGTNDSTSIFSQDGDAYICTIEGGDITKDYTLEEKKAMAHRVVKAVNNHDGLVSALRKCLFDLKYEHINPEENKANIKESVALGEKALNEIEKSE